MADPLASLPEGFTVDNVAPPPPPTGFTIDQSAPQMTGVAREVALPATSLAQGALTTLGSPGDLLGTFVHLYSKYIGAPLAQATLGEGKVFSGSNPIDSPTLVGAARTLGLVDRPDLQPQNVRERYESAAFKGIGAALPYAATGGAAALPSLIASGAGGGIGAQAGEDIAPGSTIAPIIGGLAGGGAGGALANTGTRAVNAARGATSPVVEAYDRLGIPTELVGDVSGSPAAQQLQAFAAKAPGGAGRIEASSGRVVDAFTNAVERTAANLGDARNAQAAGETLQNDARNWWKTIMPARDNEAWAPVNAMVPPSTRVPLINYRNALQDMSGGLERLPETRKLLLSPQAQNLLDAIEKDLPGMLRGGHRLGTWEEAQQIRSAIGDARGIPELSKAISSDQLGNLYRALSEDMRAATRTVGPQAEDAFNAANAVTTQSHAFIDNVISKITGTKNPLQETITPERAAQNILNSGDTTLQALRRELPDALDNLAAYKLRDMALATPGRQNAAGNLTSPGTFLTDLNNLRMTAPNGTRALFADQTAAGAIDDLATVAHSIKQTAQRLNTSNTAPNNALFTAIGTAAPAAMTGYYLGGMKGAALGGAGALATPFLGGYGTALAMTSPRLARTLAAPGAAPASVALPGILGAAPPPPMLLPRSVQGLLGAYPIIP